MMKQNFTSLLSLLFITSILSGQCFESGWSHPKIQGNTLRCVHALGSVAYTGGDAGTVLKTIDNGVTWSFANIDTPHMILGIYFLDPNTGFATSRQGVYKTINGGLNWEFTQLSTSSWMYDVQFVSDSVGIVCGQNGLIYRTTDGGESWSVQNSWSSRHLFALHFPDPLNGYAVGGANSSSVGGKVLKTIDGGISWTNFTPLDQKINDVYFTSAQKGFCVTDFGRLITTTDGGASWTITNLSNQQLLGVQFASLNDGIIVGLGDPWITEDGGDTWEQIQVPSVSNTFWALSTPDIGQHIIVGAAGQIITGSNLLSSAELRTEAETGNTINDIVFKDDLHGIACGTGGVVMQTSDGGGSWELDTNWAFGQNHHVLAKVETETAFMAGSGGQIWKTSDWGENWSQLITGVNNQLYDINFINPDTGWVAGTNGLLLRTFDSGNTWTAMPTGTNTNLNAVYFRNSGTGWIVGASGQAHKSTDFGSTWESAYFGNSSTKEEIVFFNDSIGYAGGSTSTIYYTHNGGTTWLGGSITSGAGIKSILPLSAAEAIGVGGFGNHYITADTGKVWTELPLITDNLLYKVYAQDTTIWVTGGEGTILKSGFRDSNQLLQYDLQVCSGDSIQIGGDWVYTSGVYRDTLRGLCDTLLEINVQVQPESQFSQSIDLCLGDSLFVGGAFQTTAGTYVDTLNNQFGCDSLHTTIINLLPPADFTYDVTICYGDSISFFNQMLGASGTYQDSSLNSITGCDSVVTLNLNVYEPSVSVDSQTACDSYIWQDGNTYMTSNNNATWTVTNTVGCDSVITLDLTINTVDDSVIQNENTLMANVANASYRWLDCNNNFAFISNETNQSYTAFVNGNYAVEITQNSCVDTSACYQITIVDAIENDIENKPLLYENPTDGNFSIDLGANYSSVTVTIYDMNGKFIDLTAFEQTQLLHLKLDEPAGVYLVMLEYGGKKTMLRLVVE